MSTVQITILDDGPLEVSGPITLSTEDGRTIDVPAGEPVYLCRCGGSTQKPFCDGTHSTIGFQGATKAVAEADSK
jgi:CDGSH-type Zn-finger protein